jgi:hypothetical protein
MALDRGWILIVRCAVTGFALAMTAAICMVVRAPAITGLLMVFSPGIWFFPELAFGDTFESWFLFGIAPVVNGALYALVGAVIAGLRRPTSKPR